MKLYSMKQKNYQNVALIQWEDLYVIKENLLKSAMPMPHLHFQIIIITITITILLDR